MADTKNSYVTSADLTIGLASLATDSSLLTGRESTAYDNTTNKYLDVKLSGLITTGTTPTDVKEIDIFVVAESKDGTYPDVFDGTDSAETVTSVQIRDAICILAKRIATNNTSDRGYYFESGSVAAMFGGVLPQKFVVFVTHNTGVNLNATAGNHFITVKPNYETIV